MKLFNNIPYELKEHDRWCNWKLVNRNGRETKLPVNSLTGEPAKSNDEGTWSSFEVAEKIAKEHNLGIGYFFKSPYFGIDIDDVRTDIDRYLNDDTDGNIVSEFVDLMGSYSEISTSGNGIHIIAKGELPKNGSRKGNIEMYSSGRFFIMTGDKLGPYHSIVDDSDYGKINYLHNKYIASNEVSTVRNNRV